MEKRSRFLLRCYISFFLHIKVVGHLGTLILECYIVESAKERLEGLFTLLGFELAFPYDDHLPTVIVEQLVVVLIPFLISFDLVHPELTVILS